MCYFIAVCHESLNCINFSSMDRHISVLILLWSLLNEHAWQ